jgi:hypothetical protein
MDWTDSLTMAELNFENDRCHFCDLQARYTVGRIMVCKECL